VCFNDEANTISVYWQTCLKKNLYEGMYIQDVQLKSGPYLNMSNLFTKIYNMLYYTTNLYLQ